ncbi:MAG: hypothetical protein VX529_06540 [Pseudomonadota bacterium]|nr:hypothetical protein [Pseudomonadota bacterium]
MSGRPGYPDGFADLPQDQQSRIDPTNRYVMSNGRLDTDTMDLDRVAINAIRSNIKSSAAMVWVLTGSRKLSEEFDELISEGINEIFAERVRQLEEAEEALANG